MDGRLRMEGMEQGGLVAQRWKIWSRQCWRYLKGRPERRWGPMRWDGTLARRGYRLACVAMEQGSSDTNLMPTGHAQRAREAAGGPACLQ
jgi:hypothetical protein